MKEGTKVHTGTDSGFGNKAEIEKLMLDLDAQHGKGDNEQEEVIGGAQGTVLLLYT